MEQAQSVGLHDLRESEDAAQFVGGRWNLDRKQGVAGFRRCNQVADRADAADARHQRRHFGKRAAFAEFLKAAELRNVEAGILDVAVLVEVQRDLRVALDAGYGINDDGSALCHNFS